MTRFKRVHAVVPAPGPAVAASQAQAQAQAPAPAATQASLEPPVAAAQPPAVAVVALPFPVASVTAALAPCRLEAGTVDALYQQPGAKIRFGAAISAASVQQQEL